MLPFAVDALALVLRAGVVDRADHRLVQRDQFQHHRRKHLAQWPVGPGAATEDAMKTAPMSLGQRPEGPQDGGDSALAHRKDRANHQDGRPLESRARECYREGRNERLRRLGNAKHIGLLSDSQDCDKPRMYGGVRFFVKQDSCN